jgi:hypothetical protein
MAGVSPRVGFQLTTVSLAQRLALKFPETAFPVSEGHACRPGSTRAYLPHERAPINPSLHLVLSHFLCPLSPCIIFLT